ncbi:radical SAM protein [Alphaproteobacteria bacterium]|nr:radical SAM protein [Alphaproteobacteria bacterium]
MIHNKPKIGLVQINNSFSGQNYLPYSTACLESFVTSQTDDFIFLPHIYKRMPISKIVSLLDEADIIGFSTYVWNAEISLEVARRIKKKNPNKLIVFGGPQVPDQPKDFLKANSFIDVVVHNEGEKTFYNLLKIYPKKDWDHLTGISYLKGEDGIHKSMPTPRMRDLEELPSPFFNGFFDKLIRDNPSEKWIGLWESNRGCPFQCTFCDWGSATASKVTKFEETRLFKEIDWFAKNKIEYIFVCDANFGIQKRDVQLAEYVAETREKTGYPHGFSVQNTKNATERAYLTQKILADAGLNKGVALSMQSLDQDTLKNIKRDNISLDTYLELARRFTRDKVETYSDLILGLPGETYESFCKGVDLLVKSGQHNRIQFNNLSILPNAEMGNPDYLKKHGMKIIKSDIINIHGSKEILDDDVKEVQDLVIATKALSQKNWAKTRSYAWMASFLHFNKLFQIPIIYLLENSKITFSQIIEAFTLSSTEKFPVVSEANKLFLKEARSIQKGGPEYIYSKEYLGIYWPADEYLFIKLTVEDKINGFYDEAKTILLDLIKKENLKISKTALNDALKINKNLISKPNGFEEIELNVKYDMLTFWNEIRQGNKINLKRKDVKIIIDQKNPQVKNIDDWCQKVVWWGNKKGDYLYKNTKYKTEPQISGHY